MSRYADFDAGRLVKASVALADSGDGIWAVVLGPMILIASLITLIATLCSGAGLFSLIPLFFLLASGIPIVTYMTQTWESQMYKDDYIIAANKHYKKIIDPGVKSYADPLMRNIYQHAKEDHEGYNEYNCTICKDRLGALAQLIPKKISDKSDIEEAQRFAGILKELS